MVPQASKKCGLHLPIINKSVAAGAAASSRNRFQTPFSTFSSSAAFSLPITFSYRFLQEQQHQFGTVAGTFSYSNGSCAIWERTAYDTTITRRSRVAGEEEIRGKDRAGA